MGRRTFLNGVSQHLTQTGYTIYQQPFRGLQNDIQTLMHADIAYRIENDISDSKKAKFAAAHGQSPTQKCTFCEKMGHPKKRCYKYKKRKANQKLLILMLTVVMMMMAMTAMIILLVTS